MTLLLPPPPPRAAGTAGASLRVAREGRLIGQRQHGEAGKEESEAEHTGFFDNTNHDKVNYSKKVL